MYVFEGYYLAKMTVFTGLLWFRKYPNLCKAFFLSLKPENSDYSHQVD